MSERHVDSGVYIIGFSLGWDCMSGNFLGQGIFFAAIRPEIGWL